MADLTVPLPATHHLAADHDDRPYVDVLTELHFMLAILADKSRAGRLDTSSDTAITLGLGARQLPVTMSIPDAAALHEAWETSRADVLKMLHLTTLPLFMACITDPVERTAVQEWLNTAADRGPRMQVLVSVLVDTIATWTLA